MRALCALAVAPLPGACSCVGGFLQEQSQRPLFKRGYVAEMAVEGTPVALAADGLRVRTDLRHRPGGLARDDSAHRLDVYAHGGGLNTGAKDDETQVNRNFAIALARLGFVVLNINHRLADEARQPAQAQDMAAAVHWGIEHADRLHADASRIVLAGFSSGGYLAALMAADPAHLRAEQVEPSRLSAVLAVSGFFDLDHLARAFLVHRFIVEPAFGPRGPAWTAASPSAQAGPHWPPTLLVTAEEDRSAAPESDELCSRLGARGVHCARLVVPSTRHATAIARLGDGRAIPEFEAIAAFLQEAVRTARPARTDRSEAGGRVPPTSTARHSRDVDDRGPGASLARH
jgi:acetyl esterase/lipase